MKPVSLLLFVLAALWYTPSARAADPCPQLRTQLASTDIATRIAAVACQENHAWFRPFIDADGRAGGQTVYEAENDALADGAQAWRKVAAYWSGSGLGSGCGNAGAACRSFVVDTPWSAAFVSWVMRQARVPGFSASSRHVDYVRAARRASPTAPYRLVGGNVQQTVALRMLRLDETGRFADLPTRSGSDAPCSPDVPAHCNLNRQDWAALLKLTADVPASLLAARP